MALPTVPTITTLVTEAFARGGVPSPSAAQLLRAEDEWLQEVLREISSLKRWHALENTVVQSVTPFVQNYAIPSPLKRISGIRWFSPGLTGTAGSGTDNTITIASGLSENDLEGNKIFTTGGTGPNQARRVTDYDPATGIVTVATDWTTNPDATTTYSVPFSEWQLHGPELHIHRSSLNMSNDALWYEPYEESVDIWPIVDQVGRVMEIRGQVDLMLVDEANALWTRILREWREALILGLMMRIFEDHDDVNRLQYIRLYEAAKLRIMIEDSRKYRRQALEGPRSIGGMPVSGFSRGRGSRGTI